MNLKDIRKKREKIIIEEGSQEKVSLEEIIKFEEKYNIKIPEQYRDFLLEFNGVNIEVGQFIPPDDDNDVISLVNFSNLEYSEVGTSDDSFSEDGFSVLPPKGFLTIADTSGGHSEILICVEQNENYGKIFYNEERQEEWTYLLANSFEEFFNNSIPKYENEFHKYCMEGEIEKAINLVNNGFKCDYMVYFALEGNYNYGNDKQKDFLELIKLLIEKGADLSGMLSYSAFINATEIVKLIHQKGGNINERNFYGTKALDEALNNKNFELIEYLIKSSDNIKMKNNFKKKIIAKTLETNYSTSIQDKEFVEKLEQIIKNYL